MGFERAVSRTVLIVAVCVLLVGIAILFFNGGGPSVWEGLSWPELGLDPNDRLLVLAPHPDDEVLGCGGVIQQAIAKGLPVRVVFFTFGDFYEWSFTLYKKHPVLTPRGVRGMGEVRHGEAIAADSVLGLTPDHLTFLGYPDFGTLDMWRRGWGQAPPVKGLLTRATAVPYGNALRPGAPYKGEEVIADLLSIFREFRPTKVFVSHPADHHPDHKAFYLFTHVALFDVEQELSPQIYAYLVHYSKWPVPLRYRPGAPLWPPAFLRDEIAWRIVPLDARQTGNKQTALKEHRSQYKATPKFLDSFVRSNELFGDFPIARLEAPAVPPPSGDMPYASAGRATVLGRGEAHLVGIVKWTAQVESEDLVFSITLAEPLARELGCSAYLFGYRYDTPFAQMPKLHIRFGALTHEIYDGDRRIDAPGIRVHRSGRATEIRVPLTALRHPQKILTTAQTYVGPVPLEWTSWRIMEMSDTAGRAD